MICAAAADKKTRVYGLNNSADVVATRQCLTALGAEFKDESGGYCTVTPIRFGGNPTGGFSNRSITASSRANITSVSKGENGRNAENAIASAQAGIKTLEAVFINSPQSFPISDLRIKENGRTNADSETEERARSSGIVNITPPNAGAETEISERENNTENGCGASVILNCRESGSTLRFLLPFAAALGADAEFRTEGRLSERPIYGFIGALEKNGVKIVKNGGVVSLRGVLSGGKFAVDGSVSSQFVSGLLMALPCVGGGVIDAGKNAESRGYVDITLGIMEKFGVKIVRGGDLSDCARKNTGKSVAADGKNGDYTVNGGGFNLRGGNFEAGPAFEGEGKNNAECSVVADGRNGIYTVSGSGFRSPGEISIEGDWSNAAFFIVAAIFNGNIILNNLDLNSAQPDREIVNIIRRMGGKISLKNGGVVVKKSALEGTEIDAQGIPDIIPVLSLAAGAAKGRTTVVNAGRLRIKECDRLRASADMLNALGAKTEILGDTLVIDGIGGRFRGAVLDGHNDHRMVMCAAAAAFNSDGPIEITGAEAVGKSYPDFFEDLEKLTK
jgi:3-phosphoshikimate 1-carboxyvinyltransferase